MYTAVVYEVLEYTRPYTRPYAVCTHASDALLYHVYSYTVCLILFIIGKSISTAPFSGRWEHFSEIGSRVPGSAIQILKKSYGDFQNRNFEKSHRTTGPRSDLRPDSWSWANSGLDPTSRIFENESFLADDQGVQTTRIKRRHSTKFSRSHGAFSGPRLGTAIWATLGPVTGWPSTKNILA